MAHFQPENIYSQNGFDFSRTNLRSALVVGHPGHELMVHSWLQNTQPMVFVFTDGSGRSNRSRLPSTSKILDQAGASRGAIYGRLTDAESYASILAHNFDLFIQLAQELAESLALNRIDYVAGDAFEGYNPMHDVCRLTINAAVNIARRNGNPGLGNLDFSLVSPPTISHHQLHKDGICRSLDDAAFAQKMTAARQYTELSGEVDAAVERTSSAELRVECLRPVQPNSNHYNLGPPHYELYGEKQVSAGYYREVLRYREHIAPLAEALHSFAETTL